VAVRTCSLGGERLGMDDFRFGIVPAQCDGGVTGSNESPLAIRSRSDRPNRDVARAGDDDA